MHERRGLGPKSLVAWDMNPTTAYERIERELRTLGRLPEIGEVCCLENTLTGKERGLAMLDEVSRRFNRRSLAHSY